MMNSKNIVNIQSAYDFYRMNENDRIKAIDKVFVEDKNKDCFFFPILLDKEAFNYGYQQGLLYLSPMLKNKQGKQWFRVAAFSPDDLDLDLDFENSKPNLRKKVFDFLMQHKFKDVTYREVLEYIQAEFKSGIIN
jgi:hypothetical protein